MTSTRISASLIKSVSGEFDLATVRRLSLANMNISVMENLEELTNVEELNLSDNGISTVMGLEKLKNLKRLMIANNALSSIGGLAGLQMLEYISLQGNQIESVDDLQVLGSLPNLKTVLLGHIDGTSKNPVCSHPSYRSTMLRLCPNLVSLDGERLRSGEPAVASATKLSSGPKFDVPAAEPWLKNFSFEELKVPYQSQVADVESKFQDSAAEARKLLANADALLSHYK